MGGGRVTLYWNTIKYLKPEQVLFRLFYSVRNRLGIARRKVKVPKKIQTRAVGQRFEIVSSPHAKVVAGEHRFTFLNKEVFFDHEVDWNYAKNGKLWTYNLNYFEFLHHLDRKDGLALMLEYIAAEQTIKDGFEPYPTSLRCMAWIKFVSSHKISNAEVDQFLYKDAIWLAKNIEYHLLGNHVLENAFALLFASAYFNSRGFFEVSDKLLSRQLKEQTLSDGGHFELSPMYHCIMLARVLEAYALLPSIERSDTQVLGTLLKAKAQQMLAWLDNMTFHDDSFPNFNDSTPSTGPSVEDIRHFASSLDLTAEREIRLGDSGYRRFREGNIDLIVDVGPVGPTYQPGHAHADTFSFCLTYAGVPIIVDPGVSTYEINQRRAWERSTNAHNTIEVNNTNSSNVWGGFRVAERAMVKILSDSPDRVEAEHNGYRKMGITHRRLIKAERQSIHVVDELVTKSVSGCEAIGHLHFHERAVIEAADSKEFIINKKLKITFIGEADASVEPYHRCDGFNRLVESQRIKYRLNGPAVEVLISEVV